MKKIFIPILTIAILVINGCAPDNTEEQNSQNDNISEVKATNKQLNITILLDLSDRIEPTKYPANPQHFERDISIVNYFTEYFKKDMEKRGVFKSKGKLKVVFSPRPKDSEINDIASKLKVNLENKNSKEKKEVFETISENFKESLTKIYTKTIDTKKYLGSDTWRFFKNDVKDYCVDESGNYRNILVLITDGYIFHVDSKDLKEQRSQYLTPEFIYSQRINLIGDINIVKERIKKYDYGYMTATNDLDNLEILVLEINPTPKRKNDEDVIKEYLSKWFSEMNVKDFALYNSDLPEYTKERIEKYMNK